MTSTRRIFLAVDAASADLTADDRHLADALERLDVEAVPMQWGADPPAGATVVIRSTWDYVEQPARFVTWLESLAAADVVVHNPVPLLRWNLHKRYLVELAEHGVPTVPTQIVPAGARVSVTALRDELSAADIVVKPAIGGTARLAAHSRQLGLSALQRHLDAITHTEDALVQPFVDSIEAHGEISIVAVAGVPCLAVEKRAAPGDWRVHAEFGGTATAVALTSALDDVATTALRSLPTTPTYARIDVVVGPTGFQVLELELVEPELFFRLDPDLADRLARVLEQR
ncbi:MAG: hypothetical protein ABW195_07320 [Ilumatobacteraceae bacterium]